MLKVLSFLILAIKWVAKPITQIKSSSQEEKYVTSEIALAAIDLSLAHWISLHLKYKEIAKVKKSDALKEAHLRVKAAIAKYEVLNGFDLANGNPYLHLIATSAKTRDELIAKDGDRVVVINAALLGHMAIVILTYNFFKKFRERAGELFDQSESDMRELVESNKLPGRFSWNNFVERVVKEKTEQDFSFLDEYAPTTTAEDEVKPNEQEQPKEEEQPKDEQSSSAEVKSSDVKSEDKSDSTESKSTDLKSEDRSQAESEPIVGLD